jgi:hypothetical protein
MAKNEPDVKVHLTEKSGGCPICGSTGQHTHTQDDWREVIDRADPWKKS